MDLSDAYYAAAKNFDAANERLDRADAEIAKKAQSDKQSDQSDVASLRERLKAVRQSFGSTSKNRRRTGC